MRRSNATMAGGRRKFATAHAFGKKRKRRSRMPQVPSDESAVTTTSTAVCASERTAATEATAAHAMPAVNDTSRATRVDTLLITEAEQVAIERRAEEERQKLSSLSATRRKQSLIGDSPEAAASGTAFTILSLAALNQLLRCAKCEFCRGPLTVTKGDREYGVAVKLVVNCAICGDISTGWSSPRTGGNATCNPFEVNVLAARAVMSTGNGQTVLNDIFAALNISSRGMHTKTYQDYVKNKMNPAALNASAGVMTKCAAAVKSIYSELNFGNPGNIAVSFDGTWLTRGHLSHICVGTVIEIFSGYVLDFQVLSNFCLGCELGPKDDDPEYSEWRVRHKCQKNTSSKPGQMEVEAAKILFGRSLEKHGLRYTTMLCDGDSRAFNSLQEEKVYGYIAISKEDCVNHVHKRMGAALRNLLQKNKGEGRPSLGGKGKLTGELVAKLTNYYGWALKEHQGHIEEMENAVLATYDHVTSTDAKPNHSRCPKGEESWCTYNKAVARQQAPPKHRYNLPAHVAEALLPVYTRLSDRKLLNRCQRGKTQNSNESLHSVIWSLVPKSKHASLFTVETAAAEAITRFNAGTKHASEAILKELHLSQGSTAAQRCAEKDQHRLVASDKKHTRAEKFMHAIKKRRMKENDGDYEPGGF